MLDGSYFIECDCCSNEHTLRFILDAKDEEIHLATYLNYWQSIPKRIWIAIKYVFGYKCKYGHWDTTILGNEQVDQLRKMCDDFKLIRQKREFKEMKYAAPPIKPLLKNYKPVNNYGSQYYKFNLMTYVSNDGHLYFVNYKSKVLPI